MRRVTRFLHRLVWWMYLVWWLGWMGAAITIWSLITGDIAFALLTALATGALITVGVVAQAKASMRRRAAARTPWPPERAMLQQQALASLELFRQPYLAALPTCTRYRRTAHRPRGVGAPGLCAQYARPA